MKFKTIAFLIVMLSSLGATATSFYLAYRPDEQLEETSLMCVFHTGGEFRTEAILIRRLPAGFDEARITNNSLHSASHQDRRRKKFTDM